MPQTEKLIQQIQDEIDNAISSFNDAVPQIQKRIFERLLLLLKELDVSGGKLKNTVANIKSIGQLKSDLEKIILSKDYLSQVKSFAQAFGAVTNLQDNYFRSIISDYSAGTVFSAVKQDAIKSTVVSLTEAGISSNVIEAIQDILRRNITTGASYTDFIDGLRTFLLGGDEKLGALEKYTREITTDSLNQYSRTYNFMAALGFGMEWMQYVGSNLKTTRPACLLLTAKRYIHISELPEILHGRIDGKTIFINPQTGIWAGGIPGTNEQNFSVNAGGYNCGHGVYFISEIMVPYNVRTKIYSELGIAFDEQGFRMAA